MKLPDSNPASSRAILGEGGLPEFRSDCAVLDVPEVAAKLVDLRGLRAVGMGAIVIVGGSLVITTLVGVVAIAASLLRGDTAETIVGQLPHSVALALFVALGGLLASTAGGYTATTIAGLAQCRHAVWAGILAVPLCLATSAILGDIGPGWLSAISLGAIVPTALLGGWLATPRKHVSFQRI
jgi:hypothetical protein